MAKLLPENRKRKLRVSKSEDYGSVLDRLEEVGRLNLPDSARFLGINAITLRTHVNGGSIPTTVIGERHFIEAEDLKTMKEVLEVSSSLAMALRVLRTYQKVGPRAASFYEEE